MDLSLLTLPALSHTLQTCEMPSSSLCLHFPLRLHQANPACLTGLRELLISLERLPGWPLNAPVAAPRNTLITDCSPVPCCCSNPDQFLTLIPLAVTNTEFANRVFLCTPATPSDSSSWPALHIEAMSTRTYCSGEYPSAKGRKEEGEESSFLFLQISYLHSNLCLKACFWENSA